MARVSKWFMVCLLLLCTTRALGAGTYKLTYFSDISHIYGIPLTDKAVHCLDAAAARNAGGGLVGLPMTGHPFNVGETLDVEGTTSYDGAQTVQVGTTANEILISDLYAAESFDGTEVVIKVVAVDLPNPGRAVRDAAGNFYYSHIRDAPSGSCVTRIAPDGTETSNLFTWPAIGMGAGTVGLSLVLDSAETYLYVLLSTPDYIIKFDVATGAA